MDNLGEIYILLYLVISIIWLIVYVIVSHIHRQLTVFWLTIFILSTLIYLPFSFYYISTGRGSRIIWTVLSTVAIFVIYMMYQIIRSLLLVTST